MGESEPANGLQGGSSSDVSPPASASGPESFPYYLKVTGYYSWDARPDYENDERARLAEGLGLENQMIYIGQSGVGHGGPPGCYWKYDYYNPPHKQSWVCEHTSPAAWQLPSTPHPDDVPWLWLENGGKYMGIQFDDNGSLELYSHNPFKISLDKAIDGDDYSHGGDDPDCYRSPVLVHPFSAGSLVIGAVKVVEGNGLPIVEVAGHGSIRVTWSTNCQELFVPPTQHMG